MTQDKSSHFKMFLKVMLTKVVLLNKIMTVLRLMKISLQFLFFKELLHTQCTQKSSKFKFFSNLRIIQDFQKFRVACHFIYASCQETL